MIWDFRGFIRKTLAAAILAVSLAAAGTSYAAAKYVFLFIGDGMGTAQRNAAELYLAGMREANGETLLSRPREAQLAMNELPAQGFIRTGSKSGVTDSAAAGTALATGRKAENGVISMNPKTGENFASLASAAHDRGMKVGIVTTAFLQDATPAVFYGHAPRRSSRYALGIQLTESGYEYFAGGGFSSPKGKDGKSRDLYAVAASKGYAIVKDLRERPASKKIIAVHPGVSGGYMPWAIDKPKPPSLAGFVDYGIALLDSPGGFFMMAEGGKIDLACHANDAAASIHETIDFDGAVARAVRFMRDHPGETLIVVTADHETGGMAIDMSKTDGPAMYRAMSTRRGSYAAFERRAKPGNAADCVNMAREFFGQSVGLTDEIKKAFRLSMTPKDRRKSAEPDYAKLYATYDPFTVACVKAADAAAGITWKTHYHTGAPVPISAAGAGSELFAGEYENTGVYDRIKSAMGK